MHIYWFAHYNLNCPSTRYRGKYPLDYLHSEYGIKSNFVYPERSFKGICRFLCVFLKALFLQKTDSIIVIQKVCSNGFYANMLKLLVLLRPQKSLYDLDDAEYLRQETQSLHFFLKNCKQITVGSRALKKYCLKFNKNVLLLTSPICPHSFHKKNKNKKLHIGWVGDFGNGKPVSKAFSHKKSLQSLLFPELLEIDFPIKLTLFGVKIKADIPKIKAFFKDAPNIEVEIPTDLNWEEDRWLYSEIAKFDIGVSPLVKHPFNEAKSAFKAKQYLSVGVPCIASDVGENHEFILHEKNGFLCKQKGDFSKYIHKIADMDRFQYLKLSHSALNQRNEYSIENYSKNLLEYSTSSSIQVQKTN